jgi:hypothetical protein
MAVIEDFALGLVVNVGVDGCGYDGAVPEEGLDEAEVDALFEEHRGDGVPEHMRREFFEPGRFRVSLQSNPNGLL